MTFNLKVRPVSRVRFFAYMRRTFVSDFLGNMTWMALSTFMLMAKSAIGQDNIPYFEFIYISMGFIGVWLAYSKLSNLKLDILWVNLTETIFLISEYIVLLTTKDLALAGIVVYGIIIGQAVFKEMSAESQRHFKQTKFNGDFVGDGLRTISERVKKAKMLGALIGSGIAAIILSKLHVDIIIFTDVILVLNIISNVYDHYLWAKYLN